MLRSANRGDYLSDLVGSEATAIDVLRAAHSLRNSDDSYVANKVYINEDLSKEEAKAAFEKKQRKRQIRNGDEDIRVGTDAVINFAYRRNVGSGAHASKLGSTEPQSPLTSKTSGSRIFSNSNLNSNRYSLRSAVCRSNPSNLIICSDSDYLEEMILKYLALLQELSVLKAFLKFVHLIFWWLISTQTSHHFNRHLQLLHYTQLPMLQTFLPSTTWLSQTVWNRRDCKAPALTLALLLNRTCSNNNLFECISFNARSVKNKLPELHLLIYGSNSHRMDYSIISICESWLNYSITNSMMDPLNKFTVAFPLRLQIERLKLYLILLRSNASTQNYNIYTNPYEIMHNAILERLGALIKVNK